MTKIKEIKPLNYLTELMQLLFSRLQSEKTRGVELQFLPAALEIQETPPSPIGRLITWLICVFFLIALVWALIGEINIVAVAHGKIIPSGHTKTIQPMEMSVVNVIHVREGQRVKTGDVLIELDATQSKADHNNIQQQQALLTQEKTRLNILLELAQGENQGNKVSIWQQAKDQLDPFHFKLLKNQHQEYRDKLHVLESSVREKESEKEAIQAFIEQLEQTLPIVNKRKTSVENLYLQKLAPESQFLELKQEWIEKKQELKAQKNRTKQIAAKVEQIQANIQQYRHEYQRNTMQEVSEKTRQLKSLGQEFIKAQQKNAFQVLKSPINGVVQQLAIHTIGGVVSPAQVLMIIVPEDDELEVEAFLENKDIGFVEENQMAEIKVEAFPFTKYGVIKGKVVSITNDAIEHEKIGLVFAMRASMENSKININGKNINLTPGMSVAVEVKTGTRRIIEYLARPVEVAMAGALRER